MKRLFLALFTLVILAPVSIAATFMLLPLWTWIEADLGIESVGHSMVAGWCFAATYGVLAVGALTLLVLSKGEGETPRPDATEWPD